MAHAQRIKARCVAWASLVFSFVLDVLHAFFNFEKGESLERRAGKIINILARPVAYFILDYGFAALSAVIVIAMKDRGFQFSWIFAAMLVFDFAVAASFIAYYHATGNDLSLGEDYRRAVNAASKKSRWWGYAGMLVATVQALFWTGPEQIVTFFRKEIGGMTRLYLALLPLCALQAIFWTITYGSGYDLWKHLF